MSFLDASDPGVMTAQRQDALRYSDKPERYFLIAVYSLVNSEAEKTEG